MNATEFGMVHYTPRGFQTVDFKDHHLQECNLQQSSSMASDDERALNRPGSSCVWLGIKDANPQIMARHASKYGLKVASSIGWVPYPIPVDVLLATRMHLNRQQVQGLISRLQHWLEHGTFEGEDDGLHR